MTSNVTTQNAASSLHRGTKRKPHKDLRWILAALSVIVLIFAGIYYVFFRIYDEGPRLVEVDGQNVQQMNGFLVHSKTWLSRAQAKDFLRRIGASNLSLPKVKKSYHGQFYIRATDFIADLNQYGDVSKFSKGRISVSLKSDQHYSYQSKGNQIHQQQIQVNGKLVNRFLAVYHNDAPYIPVRTAVQMLSRAGLKSSWNHHQIDISLKKAPNLTPVPKSAADYMIAFGQGKGIYAPSYSWRGTAYLPLYSLDEVLQQMGWHTSVSPWKWTLSSGNSVKASAETSASDTSTDGNKGTQQSGVVTPLNLTSARHPQVLAFVPFYAGNTVDFKDALDSSSAYNTLAEDIWTIDSSGDVTGSAPAGTASQADAAGYSTYAMITNLTSKGFNAEEMTSVLNSSVNRTRLHNQLLNLVESEDYAGILLDFEEIPASNRKAYNQFVSSLASDLHAAGKQLEVAVPALTSGSESGSNSAYDLAKIGQAADDVVVMAYDYSYFGGPAGPIAPIPWVQQVLAYTVAQVPSSKVVLGIDVYGYDWTGKHTTAVSLANVDSFIKRHHIHPKWDKASQAPWFQWTDNKGNVHTVYYENGKSTEAKLNLSLMYGAGGVAVWRAGLEDNAVLKLFAHYSQKTGS